MSSVNNSIVDIYVEGQLILYVNFIIIPLIAFYIWKLILKHRSILTGNFFAEGIVTYSEHGMFAGNRGQYIFETETFVSYKFYINKKLWTGNIDRWNFLFKDKFKYLAEKYPIGSKVIIYYSEGDPEFSEIERPPNKMNFYSNKALVFIAHWLVLNMAVMLLNGLIAA